MYPVTLRLLLLKKCFTERGHGNFYVPYNNETNSKMFLLKASMDIFMHPVILRLIQKFFTKSGHRNFHVSCNIETNSKMFLPTYKWSMEISTYTVTLILRIYQKFFTERVHGNFHVSCNIETNIIQKFFTERVHGNFHVSCNIETNSEILYQKGPWKFPIGPSNIETHSRLFLPKGSMEISMYPVILRQIQKFFTKSVHGNFHVSCHIKFNLKKLLSKGCMEISLYL